MPSSAQLRSRFPPRWFVLISGNRSDRRLIESALQDLQDTSILAFVHFMRLLECVHSILQISELNYQAMPRDVFITFDTESLFCQNVRFEKES